MTVHISESLWSQIQDFEFGHANSSLSFVDRLARENGWDSAFANRVVEEYRRFCFLAAIAGHPVTPSEEVDQAWHLHLLYSENYWTEFCGTVLQRPFHHGPTRGGRREGHKFQDWYGATLESYRRVFGDAPPADIWPDAADRFRDAHLFRRVNTASHWVIAKPSGRSLGRWLAPAIGLPVLGACAAIGDGGGFVLPAIGGILALVFAVGYFGSRAKPKRSRGRKPRNDGGGGCGHGVGFGGCGSSGRRRKDDEEHVAQDDRNSGSGDGDAGCGSSGCGGGCGGGCGS